MDSEQQALIQLIDSARTSAPGRELTREDVLHAIAWLKTHDEQPIWDYDTVLSEDEIQELARDWWCS